MEPTSSTNQSEAEQINSTQVVVTTASQSNQTRPNIPVVPVVHHTKNLYPLVRHTLLIICVLFSLALILLLMHQNGKSIYDNGI
jgi:hypothetical protein